MNIGRPTVPTSLVYATSLSPLSSAFYSMIPADMSLGMEETLDDLAERLRLVTFGEWAWVSNPDCDYRGYCQNNPDHNYCGSLRFVRIRPLSINVHLNSLGIHHVPDAGNAGCLVVLDFYISLSHLGLRAEKGLNLELKIKVSLSSEEKADSGVAILNSALLLLPATATAIGMYAPLNSYSSIEQFLQGRHNRLSSTSEELVVRIKPRLVTAADNLRFSAAFLIKDHHESLMFQVNIQSCFSSRWEDPTSSTSDHETVVHAADSQSHTALSWAAANGWLEYLRQSRVSKLYEKDMSERTLLSWAAGNGQELTTLFLLDVGEIDINGDDIDGRTPLSWAAGNGFESTINMLLARDDIKPDQADKKGYTPLAWAVKAGCLGVVRYLLALNTADHPFRVQFDVKNSDDETPLLLAGQSLAEGAIQAPDIVKILIEKSAENQRIPRLYNQNIWALDCLHKAVEKNLISLAKLLIQHVVQVDALVGSGQRPCTLLCTAAEKGCDEIVQVLLDAKANANFEITKVKDTPLILAARGGREKVVQLLLGAGADVSWPNAQGETAKDVAMKEQHHGIVQILAEREKDGPLAEKYYKYSQNWQFYGLQATVVDFIVSPTFKYSAKESPLEDLLVNPRLHQNLKIHGSSFRWLHLPANNMKWVEALIAGLCNNPSQQYRVLSSERWVSRQHIGPQSSGSPDYHHARFMMPLCQTFQSLSQSQSNASAPPMDKNEPRPSLVLFMPYLHWDLAEQQLERTSCMKGTRSSPEIGSDDLKILSDCSDPHPLHVRRTLDQYYYHAMNDTKQRDLDQAVCRYQKELVGYESKSMVITMVDQLWLWVLTGEYGQADTVITCFPPRKKSTADPDPYDLTDVMRNIKLYLGTEEASKSVKTPYDLAGIIASQSSKAYLEISGIGKIPGFSEMYETAIGNVTRKERELFDNLSLLTTAPAEQEELTAKIVKILEGSPGPGKQNVNEVIGLSTEFRNSPFHEPLDISDIDSLKRLPAGKMYDAAVELVKKIGRIQVLDISKEISLLREIKDIQDELNIMSILFDDQKKVMTSLDGIIRSTKLQTYSQSLRQGDKNSANKLLKPSCGVLDCITGDTKKYRVQGNANNYTDGECREDTESSNSQFGNVEKQRESLGSLLEVPSTIGAQRQGEDDANNEGLFRDIREIGSLLADEPAQHQRGSTILDTFGGHKQLGPLLAVVENNIETIRRMLQRARNANQALDVLVDLKQKQSNVLDSRSARIQAEQSLKMAQQMVKLTTETTETNKRMVILTEETVKMNKENEKQGKTLLVFTIVTIIFLPLSFMAAFFAINIAAFQRDDKGFLELGYVSEIMFPISAAITAVLIFFAFKIEWLKTVQILGCIKTAGIRISTVINNAAVRSKGANNVSTQLEGETTKAVTADALKGEGSLV